MSSSDNSVASLTLIISVYQVDLFITLPYATKYSNGTQLTTCCGGET